MDSFNEIDLRKLEEINGGGFLGFVFVGAVGTLVGMTAGLGIHVAAAIVGYDNEEEINSTCDACISTGAAVGMAIGAALPF